jgi:hypothetical protein
MIPYDSPIRHEEFTLIALSEYEDYKASPYFVYDVISEENFEDQKIYLLISPASGDSLCLKLNMNGYSVRQELPANVTTENGSYCVYAILVSPFELNVTFSPYAE